MDAYNLIISPAAKDDIKNIYDFSRLNWGETKANEYLSDISKRMNSILNNPLASTDRFEIMPNLRSSIVKSHIIFFFVAKQTIEVVRILHRQQDVHLNIEVGS